MSSEQVARVTDLLHMNRIKTECGMTEDEIVVAQGFYDVTFPPDLAELLVAFTPTADKFYRWADYSPENINANTDMLAWPTDGTLFDVEHNDFWLTTWGDKPDDMAIRLRIACKEMRKAPKLIPVFAHRYVSSFPKEAGNPVYSAYQTDIIFYGHDIWDYFEIEFGSKRQSQIDFDSIKHIPFWNDMILNIGRLAEPGITDERALSA